ncbi:heterokaryon incompatibility protein-domain-containing protein [Aspergillus ambiguus]|uniref:HET domain-containing protein n=1 Tax=Aspergillus ambiguus TaxID=176160 RepID=UPI003CCD925C
MLFCGRYITRRMDVMCSVCCKIDVKQYLFRRSYAGSVRLGGFQDILQKSDCPLCRLIIRALQANSRDFWEYGRYPIETCYLGRAEGAFAPPNLEVWFDSSSATLPPGMYGHARIVGQILLDEIKDRECEAPISCYRRLSYPQMEFSLVQEWLHSCEHVHGLQCSPSTGKDITLKFIDVKRMCIVEREFNSRYLALSYVWGHANTFYALKDNLSKLEVDGSLYPIQHLIPRVIRDAVTLTRAIGERYLWVDALCIVQDDMKSREMYVPQMNVIFGQAILTIVALSGMDASSCLPGVVSGSRKVSQIVENVDGLKLVAKLPDLPTAWNKSQWKTRGWTFQEEILSKRYLFFADNQVYFQCQSAYYTEDTAGDRSRADPMPGLPNPLGREITDNGPAYSSTFNVYECLVKSYSNRELSYHCDSLRAFSGVMSAFEQIFGWDFICGLPKKVFDLALLWKPMTDVIPRPRRGSSYSQSQICTLPTWCWAAWTGDVYWDPWRINSYAGKTIILETEVQQFIVVTDEQVELINSGEDWQVNVDIQDKILEVQKHRQKRAMSSQPLLAKEDALPDIVVFFKAYTCDLSNFSISTVNNEKRRQAHATPKPHQWRAPYHVLINDAQGRHCGTLYGRDSVMECTKNSTTWELVLLSRCRQDAISQSDVDAYKDCLSLEYPSSEEYYSEIFDMRFYKYTERWALNILLIEWCGDFARRAAVGQMHSDAWDYSMATYKVVALA